MVVNRWRLKYKIDITSYFGSLDSLRLWKCKQCSLQYFMPSIPGDEILYQALAMKNWYYQNQKWEYDQAIKDIPIKSTVLDVGCGEGAFVKMAGAVGLHPTGVDTNAKISENDSTAASRIIKGTIDQLRKSKQQWDAVVCFQVIEHLPNPSDFITACCDLLRPGGVLILAVPNDNALPLRWEPDALLNMPPHHLTRWTESTLQSIPAQFPLLLAHTQCSPLELIHIEGFVGSLRPRLCTFPGSSLLWPTVNQCITFLLDKARIRYLINGHTIYARYVRT